MQTSLDNTELIEFEELVIARDFSRRVEFSPNGVFDNRPVTPIQVHHMTCPLFLSALPQPDDFISDRTQISTATQLSTELRNNPSGDFALTNDIDLSAFNNWIPINNFSGTLNGRGFTISNLNITVPTTQFASTNYFGLFRQLSGHIFNLNISNVNISGEFQSSGSTVSIGSLVGRINGGALTNVNASDVEIRVGRPGSWQGGIVGNVANGTITNTTIQDSTISGIGHMGGIAGRLYASTISNSHATNLTITHDFRNPGTPALGSIVAYSTRSELSNISVTSSTINIASSTLHTLLVDLNLSSALVLMAGSLPRTGTLVGVLRESRVYYLSIDSISQIVLAFPAQINFVGRGNSETSNTQHPIGQAINSIYHWA